MTPPPPGSPCPRCAGTGLHPCRLRCPWCYGTGAVPAPVVPRESLDPGVQPAPPRPALDDEGDVE